jgi:hypothetical protein
MMENLISIPDEVIITKIYLLREKKVMVDRDLAELYNVETKRLKEAVKRNKNRFPEDFMFEMNKDEFENWRSQIATSNSDKMGLRYPPYCFTEQGVTMLSCILNSDRAVEVNIRIIRIFSRMRELLITNTEIRQKLDQLENRIDQQDDHIRSIFSALRELLNPPKKPRNKIGYRLSSDKD